MASHELDLELALIQQMRAETEALARAVDDMTPAQAAIETIPRYQQMTTELIDTLESALQLAAQALALAKRRQH